MNASCLSQLAHCVRLLCCCPEVLLQTRGIQHQHVRRLNKATKFLFDMANAIAPYRQGQGKIQDWRLKEQELLTLLSLQQTARNLPSPSTH